MTKLIGRLESIGIGKESTRGTAVAPTYWLQWLELALDDKVTAVPDEQSLARIEDSDDMTLTEKYGEISGKMKIKDMSLGLLLLAAFGTVASVESADTGVYDHTYSVQNDNVHDSLTIAHKSTNDDVAYALAMLESLSFDFVVDNYPTVAVAFMSKPSAAASNTVAHVAENDFLPRHMVFKLAAAQSGLDAASAISIRGANLEIAKNLFMEYDLGSNEPTEILNQSFAITGSVTIVHDGSTYADLQNAETDQAMRFQLVNTDVTIGASSNPTLTIDLNKCRFSNYSRAIALNDLIEESFDFKANYSLADAEMVSCILTNLATSY